MSNLVKAIKSINPDAKFNLVGTDLNNIEWIETTPIAVSEIQTKIAEVQLAEDAKENQKITDKANGNQKLLDLGLTQAEATALTGYTPPAEV